MFQCVNSTYVKSNVEQFRSKAQGWHGTFYPLGKTGWVKLGKRVGFTHG